MLSCTSKSIISEALPRKTECYHINDFEIKKHIKQLITRLSHTCDKCLIGCWLSNSSDYIYLTTRSA